MEPASLEGGFQDPPREAAYAFRALMNSMARPGTVEHLSGGTPPAPLSVAAGTLLLTLTDADTPVHLAGAMNTPEIRSWIAFHCGAPLVEPGEAAFALGTWEGLLPLDRFPIGTPDYPDRSATLIVDGGRVEAEGSRLTGPGIRDKAALSLPDPDRLRRNHALFPLGLDFYFTAGDRVAALPRSTRIG